MEIIDNKVLVVRTRRPQLLTDTIKKSKVVRQIEDMHEVAVHWGLPEAQALVDLKMKNIPSPIDRDYKWTGKFQPFAHQKLTAGFLSLHRKAFCFSEAGTGKTASVIWAADYLMKMGVVRRVLVICPLSIMRAAWQNDIFKFAMHRSCSIAHGSANARKQVVAEKSDFTIINFDGVAIVKDEVLNGGFDLIVVDECFVAGTPVLTPSGEVPIESLRPGDRVLTSSGVAHISNTTRKPASAVVQVRLEDGRHIRCTPEHPFFTTDGWVCAKNLTGRRLISSHDMPYVRGGVQSPEPYIQLASEKRDPNWASLFSILRTEEVPSTESGGELFQPHTARASGEGERAKISRAQTETFSDRERARVTSEGTRRERHWVNPLREKSARVFARIMGMELPRSVRAEAAGLSYQLQARLCISTVKAWVRSRRSKPSDYPTQTTGSEERSQTAGVRVESVSYIERDGGTEVFNLSINGTPNYFVAGGVLVHNCSAYKNSQTTRWKVLKQLTDKIARLWMLTGTPAAQSPVDAFGLAKLVNPAGTPKFFGAFRDQVMMKVTNFKWVPKPNAKHAVHTVLQPAIRFERAQCLDLPEVTYTEREAPLTPQQKKYYKMLRTKMAFEAAGEKINSVNAAVNINKLLQISGGAVYTESRDVVEFDVSNRLNVVLEAIEEASHKVLVFVPFTHTIQLLEKFLEDAGVPTMTINGQVSMNKRSAIVEKFQTEEDPKVLLIQPQAASHGLTLTAANTIIWYAPMPSVETYLQANARINRPGQKNPMTIIHIRGSEVENKLYNLLQNNVANHTQIVELYKQALEAEEE